MIEWSVGNSFLIFLFGELFIQVDELLLHEIHGTETVSAAAAIHEERAFVTVTRVLAISAIVAFRAVSALVAEFAVVDE